MHMQGMQEDWFTARVCLVIYETMNKLELKVSEEVYGTGGVSPTWLLTATAVNILQWLAD